MLLDYKQDKKVEACNSMFILFFFALLLAFYSNIVKCLSFVSAVQNQEKVHSWTSVKGLTPSHIPSKVMEAV